MFSVAAYQAAWAKNSERPSSHTEAVTCVLTPEHKGGKCELQMSSRQYISWSEVYNQNQASSPSHDWVMFVWKQSRKVSQSQEISLNKQL